MKLFIFSCALWGFAVVLAGCRSEVETTSGKHTTDVVVPGVNVHVETPAHPKTSVETEKKIDRDGDKVEIKEKKKITNPDGSSTKIETKTERRD